MQSENIENRALPLFSLPANLILSVPAPGSKRKYVLFYGQTILSPSEDDEEADDGLVRDRDKLWELSSSPVVVNDFKTLQDNFVPLKRTRVVQVYESAFNARGSDVVIEKVLNTIYVLRAITTKK